MSNIYSISGFLSLCFIFILGAKYTLRLLVTMLYVMVLFEHGIHIGFELHLVPDRGWKLMEIVESLFVNFVLQTYEKKKVSGLVSFEARLILKSPLTSLEV